MKRILLLLLIAVPAFAWGEKGHYISNEAATLGLPADMPVFFHKAYPDLVWLAFDPDRWRGGAESLEAANSPNHFLDYEYAAGLDLPRNRYKFIELMESSGRLRRFGIDNDTTGFVPWRVAELAELITVEFRLWRSAPPGDRPFIERDIIHYAGILGHFVADSANPHHATYNYNGWVDPNPNNYPNDCGTHSRFERDFISHAVDVKDVVPKLAKPVLRTDYFTTAVDLIKESNSLVERIYQLDKGGAFSLFGPVRPEGMEFATDRLAAGASVLRDIWWSAWVNSAEPPARRGGE